MRYRRLKRKHKKRLKMIACGLAALLVLFILLDAKLRPIIKTMAINQAQFIATQAINDAITEVMQKADVSYEKLVNVDKDGEDRVRAITANIVQMNRLKAEVTTLSAQKIAGVDKCTISIPLGTLIGGDLFTGRGPRIKIKVNLSGHVVTDIENTFDAAGINQTRHQIMLDVRGSIYILIPGYNTATEVETDLCIAQTVIVGEVPGTYAQINTGSGAIPEAIDEYKSEKPE